MAELIITQDNYMRFQQLIDPETTGLRFQNITFFHFMAIKNNINEYLKQAPHIKLSLDSFTRFTCCHFWKALPETFYGEIRIINFGEDVQYDFIEHFYQRLNTLIENEHQASLSLQGKISANGAKQLAELRDCIPPSVYARYPGFANLRTVITRYLESQAFARKLKCN